LCLVGSIGISLLVIEFLQAENRLLKERLRGKRIRFTDAERALLARKAKAVGRKALLGHKSLQMTLRYSHVGNVGTTSLVDRVMGSIA
jgi:hypothetical protein